MSKKRTSPESSSDEETNEASDSVFQQRHSAKCAKLALLSDTTLQDLPIEMLACILVQAVTMEVKGMKLAKSVWKEKADLVISRLKTVCSQWNIILTTDFFRNEVHRKIDGTALKTIRLEILQEFPIDSGVYKVTAIKDEIFILHTQCCKFGRDSAINVYNRNNLVDVKDVIPLPGIRVFPVGLAACSVSNSLYALNMEWPKGSHILECLSVWRIARDEKQQFHLSPWISDLKLTYPSITVSANGSVIILSVPQQDFNPAVLRIYNANASLQHEIVLFLDMRGLVAKDSVIQKSNGNLVLVSYDSEDDTKLTEIDITGRIIRQYRSPVDGGSSCVKFADSYERILVSGRNYTMELLDSEFNHLDFTGPQPDEDTFDVAYQIQYNRERNEILGSPRFGSLNTIFRFTEEWTTRKDVNDGNNLN